MASIPSPFDRINNTQDALAAMPDSLRVLLNVNFSNFESAMGEYDLTDYIYRAKDKRGTDINVICADIFGNTLRYAAPSILQWYMLGSNFVEAARAFNYTQLAALYDQYLPPGSECNDPAQLELYRQTCARWRRHMGTRIVNGLDSLNGGAAAVNLHVGDHAAIIGEMLDMKNKTIAEAEAISAAPGGNFSQQGSEIDTIFSAFFFAFGILDLTVAQFYRWQRVIYLLGYKIRGRKASLALLSQFTLDPGVIDMIAKTSQSTKMYLPPWVFNCSRYHDLIAVFGGVDTFNSAHTAIKPGVSLRYIHNLRADKSTNIYLIVTTYGLEKMASADDDLNDDQIYQSEHMLHQLLLPKRSPFQNTHGIRGNALNVHIIQ